ncbi:unnamed protein product [Anisakis simplex]|uniref:EH domain-containing protein n=1 Tax=Anisakis simplex TaxID=6269 RepID=A0A0M3JSY1_ANISI|nr:unnamed protein product [Anisakis simplex]
MDMLGRVWTRISSNRRFSQFGSGSALGSGKEGDFDVSEPPDTKNEVFELFAKSAAAANQTAASGVLAGSGHQGSSSLKSTSSATSHHQAHAQTQSQPYRRHQQHRPSTVSVTSSSSNTKNTPSSTSHQHPTTTEHRNHPADNTSPGTIIYHHPRSGSASAFLSSAPPAATGSYAYHHTQAPSKKHSITIPQPQLLVDHFDNSTLSSNTPSPLPSKKTSTATRHHSSSPRCMYEVVRPSSSPPQSFSFNAPPEFHMTRSVTADDSSNPVMYAPSVITTSVNTVDIPPDGTKTLIKSTPRHHHQNILPTNGPPHLVTPSNLYQNQATTSNATSTITGLTPTLAVPGASTVSFPNPSTTIAIIDNATNPSNLDLLNSNPSSSATPTSAKTTAVSTSNSPPSPTRKSASRSPLPPKKTSPRPVLKTHEQSSPTLVASATSATAVGHGSGGFEDSISLGAAAAASTSASSRLGVVEDQHSQSPQHRKSITPQKDVHICAPTENAASSAIAPSSGAFSSSDFKEQASPLFSTQ